MHRRRTFCVSVLHESDNSFLQCAGGYSDDSDDSDSQSSSFSIVPYASDVASKLLVAEYGAPCERRQVGSLCLVQTSSRRLDSACSYCHVSGVCVT
jgi:hypothetical protein